jgi:hypothetical protein
MVSSSRVIHIGQRYGSVKAGLPKMLISSTCLVRSAKLSVSEKQGCQGADAYSRVLITSLVNFAPGARQQIKTALDMPPRAADDSAVITVRTDLACLSIPPAPSLLLRLPHKPFPSHILMDRTWVDRTVNFTDTRLRTYAARSWSICNPCTVPPWPWSVWHPSRGRALSEMN